jgi:hypothetical protein
MVVESVRLRPFYLKGKVAGMHYVRRCLNPTFGLDEAGKREVSPLLE